VWIDFFRADATPQVVRMRQIIRESGPLMGDLILAEIMQGVRESEIGLVESTLRPLRVVPLVGEAIARQSARNYRQLRSRGITVRKIVDCFIATWCIENQVPLLHSDQDFAAFVALGLLEDLPFDRTVH
jgi:hypothetical protein